MADKQFDEVIRDAGLSEESIRLIIDNKLIAKAVASAAAKICDKFRAVAPTSTKERSKWEPSRILKAIVEVQRSGNKVTGKAVSKNLGCHPATFSRFMTKYPDVKGAYLAARNGS